MKRIKRVMASPVPWGAIFLVATIGSRLAAGYTMDYITPAAGGCPVPAMQNLAAGAQISRQWSTALLYPPTIITQSPYGSQDQILEIQNTILPAYGSWTGVAGTLMNATAHPYALANLNQTPIQDACTDDALDNVDGVNTICFSQPSDAFTTGVLSITRVIVADAPGVVVGAAGPSLFAGQILDADILLRPDGQATFATPEVLGTSLAPGAYDLESILIHEIGSVLGLDVSGVWRSAMFVFPPPPGTYLGSRPTNPFPDAPLADDDRAGLRTLYADGSDATDVGVISGHVLPANPFELAATPLSSPETAVTGAMDAEVVATDAQTGEVIAAALGGWSCSPSVGVPAFDGFYSIEHLPLTRTYALYAEPLIGALSPDPFANVNGDLCVLNGDPFCTPPPADTNFSARFQPAMN